MNIVSRPLHFVREYFEKFARLWYVITIAWKANYCRRKGEISPRKGFRPFLPTIPGKGWNPPQRIGQRFVISRLNRRGSRELTIDRANFVEKKAIFAVNGPLFRAICALEERARPVALLTRNLADFTEKGYAKGFPVGSFSIFEVNSSWKINCTNLGQKDLPCGKIFF